MEVAKMCGAEEFESLKQKAFRNIPIPLLRVVISKMPDYASVVYLALYDLSQLNSRYPGTVIISHQNLSLMMEKSVSSVRRAINKLRELGYISFKQKREPEKNYLPNIIQVGCPEILFQKIQAEEPDRKKNTFTLASSLQAFPTRVSTFKAPSEPILIINLYERYKASLKRLRETGISLMAASQQAYQDFSKEEITHLQQYILESSRFPSQDFSSSSVAKMTEGCSKMNTIRSINNRDHNLQLTIEAPLPVDNLQKSAEPNSFVMSKRHFGESKAEIVQFLNPEQRSTIVKKLKWMRKQTDGIHPLIQEKYPNIEVLIKETAFHIMHRNKEKTQDFIHSLRSAAKMIRNGTWSTPKRLVQMQITQREEDATRLKQAEIRQANDLKISQAFRNFVENTKPSYQYAKN